MYKGLYDSTHTLFKVPTNDLNKDQKLQTGEFESNILCQNCESLLSKYEGYAKDIFYGGGNIKYKDLKFENQKNQQGVSYTYCQGIDYNKFKLFLLSILWKSSVSSKEFFEQIKLGPHEDIIRKMIINGDPGDFDDYPCVLSTYLNHKKKIPPELIGQPARIKDNLGTRYSFLIGGVSYFYFISRATILRWVFEVAVNKRGEMKLIHMNDEQAKKIVNKFIGNEIYK